MIFIKNNIKTRFIEFFTFAVWVELRLKFRSKRMHYKFTVLSQTVIILCFQSVNITPFYFESLDGKLMIVAQSAMCFCHLTYC